MVSEVDKHIVIWTTAKRGKELCLHKKKKGSREYYTISTLEGIRGSPSGIEATTTRHVNVYSEWSDVV